jgi:hypothetical protein
VQDLSKLKVLAGLIKRKEALSSVLESKIDKKALGFFGN